MAIKEIEVRMSLVATEEGGRRSPLKSGYIGNFHIAGLYTGAMVNLQGRQELAPGESCRALLRLPNWEYVASFVRDGSFFEITEAQRAVAKGTVLRTEPVTPDPSG